MGAVHSLVQLQLCFFQIRKTIIVLWFLHGVTIVTLEITVPFPISQDHINPSTLHLVFISDGLVKDYSLISIICQTHIFLPLCCAAVIVV